MTKREWQIQETDNALWEKIAKENNLLPLTAKILINRGLIEKERISIMKRGVVIVNTARGERLDLRST